MRTVSSLILQCSKDISFWSYIHLSPSTNLRSKHTHLATVLGDLLFLGMVNTAVRCWLSTAEAFACVILCNYRDALTHACMMTITLSTSRRSCMYFPFLCYSSSACQFSVMSVSYTCKYSCTRDVVQAGVWRDWSKGWQKLVSLVMDMEVLLTIAGFFLLRNLDIPRAADFLSMEGFPALTLFTLLHLFTPEQMQHKLRTRGTAFSWKCESGR